MNQRLIFNGPKPITFEGSMRPQMPERLAKAWKAAQGSVPRPPKNAAVAANVLLIYDMIGYDWWTGGGITPADVNDWLAAVPNGTAEIEVRINSPGGNVFDGIAIYNALINCGMKVNVRIDALAASVASIIAMAGDQISIAGNGEIFVHKAWSIAMGNADDFTKEAAALNSIDGSLVATYVARTGQSEDDIRQMMKDETWLNAATAKEKGFVETIDPLKTAPEQPAADSVAVRHNILRQRTQLLQRQAIAAA